ncbi:MAG: hypothetical protein ACJ72D_14785 [Marmoricola sp.]
MTEPNKHRHQPKRAARPARGARVRADQPRAGRTLLSAVRARARTTTGMLVIAVVVLGLAVVLRFAVGGGGDDAKADKPTAQKGPGAASATYGNVWTTVGGYKYEISVETLKDLVAVGSPSACIAAPASAGTTNLHFRVTIKNKSKKDAPVPEVLFGTNLRTSGAVLKKLPKFSASNQHLEVVPLAKALTCPDGARLGPDGRDKIPAGASEQFTGTFGPTKVPVPGGIAVLVRYFAADGSAGSGEKATDLVAPFGPF